MKIGMILMRVSVPNASEGLEPIMASKEQMQIIDVASAMAIKRVQQVHTAKCV